MVRIQFGGNQTLAEKVTQDVFIALAIKASYGDRIEHLCAWLHATTR